MPKPQHSNPDQNFHTVKLSHGGVLSTPAVQAVLLQQAVLFLGVYPKHLQRGSIVGRSGGWKQQGMASQVHLGWRGQNEVSRDSGLAPTPELEQVQILVPFALGK